MSKEEFLKIQTCVLKVNIHCDGCKHKVKKILQKIDGVYTTKIDQEQGKVTVSGNVDPATLVKKLAKNGKHAEIWGTPKPNNNNNNQNQLKNPQIDNGKGGNYKKGQVQKDNNNNQPKGGASPPPHGQNQQLQQLQHLKGFQDLKLPPQFMKDMKMPPIGNNNKEQNHKSGGKPLILPEDHSLSDDDFDDEDYDDEFEDDEFDDDDDDLDNDPLNNKMKPMKIGNGGHAHAGGGSHMPPNMLMSNMLHGLKAGGVNVGGNNGGNGVGANVPVQMNTSGSGSQKGGIMGNNNGGNQNQGGGKGGNNGGAPLPGGNGGQNKNGGGAAHMNNLMTNGVQKGGEMNAGRHGVPNMFPMNGGGGGGGGPICNMGNHPSIGQMRNLAAVQGLPAMNGSGGQGPPSADCAGYPQGGGGREQAARNPCYQQQLAAVTMNQQCVNGNEMFQPMIYARPPPAVNYMPPYTPYPYPYPYPHPPPPGERAEQYSMFSNENTSSCSVM